jgi:hypothetical protein
VGDEDAFEARGSQTSNPTEDKKIMIYCVSKLQMSSKFSEIYAHVSKDTTVIIKCYELQFITLQNGRELT